MIEYLQLVIPSLQLVFVVLLLLLLYCCFDLFSIFYIRLNTLFHSLSLLQFTWPSSPASASVCSSLFLHQHPFSLSLLYNVCTYFALPCLFIYYLIFIYLPCIHCCCCCFFGAAATATAVVVITVYSLRILP